MILSDIKRMRTGLGLSQAALANHAGVSQSLIAKVEAGRIDPTYSHALKLFSALTTLSQRFDVHADQLMTRKVITVPASETIVGAVRIMKRHNISQMPVVEHHHPIGIISESLLLEALLQDRTKPLTVRDVMGQAPPIVAKDTGLLILTQILASYPLVLIAEKGVLIGIVTKSDLLARHYSMP